VSEKVSSQFIHSFANTSERCCDFDRAGACVSLRLAGHRIVVLPSETIWTLTHESQSGAAGDESPVIPRTLSLCDLRHIFDCVIRGLETHGEVTTVSARRVRLCGPADDGRTV